MIREVSATYDYPWVVCPQPVVGVSTGTVIQKIWYNEAGHVVKRIDTYQHATLTFVGPGGSVPVNIAARYCGPSNGMAMAAPSGRPP